MFKRIVFLVLIVFILVGRADAQYKTVLLGLRGGFNMGWLKSPDSDYQNKGLTPGLSWGFVSEFYFMENYAVLTGFNIQYLKGRLEYPYLQQVNPDSAVTGILQRKYKLNYIQIPVCIKMKAGLSDKINFFGKVGFGAGFRIDAKASDTFTYDQHTSESESDIKKDISFFRGSLILGLGVEYVIKGSTAVIMGLNYDNGFIDVLKGSNPAFPGMEEKANLNFLELDIGIVF